MRFKYASLTTFISKQWFVLLFNINHFITFLANRKSGSNRSDEVLSLFRGLLNPIQVFTA